MIRPDDVKTDLTTGRPRWILSAYCPGKDTPAVLFKENEYSPEEVRWRFYQQQIIGQAEAAEHEFQNLQNKAQQDIQNALSNVNGLTSWMEEQEKVRPNRYDLVKTDGKLPIEEVGKNAALNTQPGSSMNPFGGSRPTAEQGNNPFARAPFGQQNSAFGQAQQPSSFGQTTAPSAFGARPETSAFGKPAFGTPAFGQSSFGQTSQPSSAFGQSSAIGGANSTSPFAKPAASSFGQASNLGQNASANPFAKPAASSGFGQPSAFGQNTSANPFAKPSASSGFGAAGVTTTSSGFGSGSFGQQASSSPFNQPNKPPTAFSQPSAFGQQKPAFGQPSTVSSGFGSQTSQASGFGTAAPAFGQSAFGQPSQPQKSAFGQSQTPQQPAFGQNPFGQASSSAPSATVEARQTPEVPMGGDSRPQTAAGPDLSGGTTASAPAPALPATQSNAAPSINAPPDISGVNPPNGQQQSHPLHYSQTLPAMPAQYAGNGDVISYRGQRVRYIEKLGPDITGEEVITARYPVYHRPDGKGAERIWFPDGKNDKSVRNVNDAVHRKYDYEADPEKYTDEVLGLFRKLFETGRWEGGKMPLVPPQRSWIDYDF